MSDTLYFRQLKAGRDFGRNNPVATQMDNFIYLIGDTQSRECLVVDPAWDVAAILDRVAEDGMTLTGALVSHWHPDHVGGPMFGHDVEGLTALLERVDCPIHVHRDDVEWVGRVTGLAASELAARESGDKVVVGSVEVECLHTPGHTAGSQCFRCAGKLIAGDTLFLQGCGRVDLPGSDVEQMWETLTRRLATLPDDVVLYPGHDYGDRPFAPMGEVRRTNHALNAPTLSDWRRTMGR